LSLRNVWLLTIMLMLISGISHLALRAAGQRYGLLITGLASGFVSGTATFASMAALAKSIPEQVANFAAAAIISCAAGVIQAALIILAIHPATLHAIWPSLAAAGLLALAIGLVRARQIAAGEIDSSASWRAIASPLQLKTMVLLVSVLSLANVLGAAVAQYFGERSLALAIASISVVDSHPAIASVANLAAQAKLSNSSADRLVLLALSASLLGKIVVARVGGVKFVAQLLVPCLAIIAALWLPHYLVTR
jgi:uncharacterized membrane protein (DUF4010 family)